jgi:hypothetical protein
MVKYARTSHYSHIDKDSEKPQFTYCKLEDLETLKTLLSQQNISLTTDKDNGSIGQGQTDTIHDLKLKDLSRPVQQNICGRRLAGLGHKPSKLAITGSNPVDRTNASPKAT